MAQASGAKRILVVVPKLTIGGTEQHLLTLLPRLRARGFAIEVATTRGPGRLDQAMRQQGVRVSTAPAMLPGRANAPIAALWLWWRVRRRSVDLVHFFLPEAYLIGGLASWLAGRSRLIMSRRSLNLYQRGKPISRWLEGRLHRHMNAVIGNSRAVLRQLAEEGVPQHRLALIYNGVDSDRFAASDRMEARRALDIPSECLVLLTVATLLPYKGHADLLNALTAVADEMPENWTLLLAGRNDGIGEQLRHQAEAVGLAGHIRWLGECDQVPQLLAASDICVLASHEEGFPNALLEAMAAGLPVVATDVGGCPEAVADGVTGLLVPAHSPAALGQAILELARDPQKRRRMGEAGGQRAKTRFSLEACVTAYAQLYDAVLEDRPLSAASPSVHEEACPRA